MCRSVMKYILFVFNLIFVIIGLALIGVGVLLKYKLQDVLNIVESELLNDAPVEFDIDLQIVPYIIIIFGIIVFLISFSGCCGAVTESKCLLISYTVCLALLAALKISVIILLLVKLTDFKTEIENSIDEAFDDPKFNETFHVLEALFKCCGTRGPDSYINELDLTAPTCCENPTPSTICHKENAFEIGCTTKIANSFEDIVKIFSYTLFGPLVVELLSLLFSIYIVRTTKDSKTYIKTVELKYSKDSQADQNSALRQNFLLAMVVAIYIIRTVQPKFIQKKIVEENITESENIEPEEPAET